MSVQVVEECLVEELSKILEPIDILSMSPEMVSKIAGETEESRNNRKALGEKLVILSKGMESCRRYARAGVDGKSWLTEPIPLVLISPQICWKGTSRMNRVPMSWRLSTTMGVM
jgi:hypothetical protein